MSIPTFELALVERAHTAPLPTIATEGYRLKVVFAPFEEVRQRFLGGGEWDAAEIPLGRYLALKAAGDDTLTAIPVFPWRSFRHGAIHVRKDGSITSPKDLEGRRVGVTDWHQTAGIVARGLLSGQYGVRLDRIDWIAGGLDGPARPDVAPVPGPRGFTVQNSTTPLSTLLREGVIDAVIAADAPENAAELLPDREEVEAAWFARTGIFPLMHAIAIRRTALNGRFSPDELFRVFDLAKAASPVAEDAKWRYGLDANKAAVEQLLSDAFAQGIGERRLQAADIFLRQ